MTIDFCIKSGTSGYYDTDNCNLLIASKVEAQEIPRQGDIVEFGYKKYLVTEIQRSYIIGKDNNWREYITVYVIKY